MVRFGSFLVALALVLAGNAVSNGQTLLRWKFKAGDVSHMTMIQDMKQTIRTGEAAAVPVNVGNTMDMTWKVESVDSQGVASVAQTFDRIRMKTEGGPGVAIEFDSASKTEPEGPAKMIATMMKPLVGAKMVLKMTARGDVVDVKLSEGLAPMQKMAAAGGMGEMLSPEGIKKMSGLGVLPEKPVKPGDSWSNTVETKNPLIGNIVTEQKYTYLGPAQRDGQQLEKIGVATRTKPSAKKAEAASGIHMDGEGITWFDNRAGRMVASETAMKMKMDMNLMGQKMVMNGESTAKIQVSVAGAKSPPK